MIRFPRSDRPEPSDAPVEDGDGERGFTLLETLLVVTILGILMVPVVGWGILALQRSSDTRDQEDAAGSASVSRMFIKDVEAAYLGGLPPIAGSLVDCANTPVDPMYPAGGADVSLMLLTDEFDDLGEPTTVMTVYSVTEATNADGEVRGTLWRRQCPASGGQTDSFRLISGLVPVNPAGDLHERYAVFACQDGVLGSSDACRTISLTIKTPRKGPATIRAVRRPDPLPTTETRPRAVITCSPSCTGFRDAAQQMTVSLDASRSVNAVAFGWDFGNGQISDQKSPPAQTYSCTSSSPEWDNVLKECRFTVTLSILSGETPPRSATATAVITVRNNPPSVVLVPESIDAVRGQQIDFVTAGTIDPDGTITYAWNFGDADHVADPAGRCPNSNTSTLAQPCHVYHRLIPSGQATLTVTDNDGAAVTRTIPLRVRNAPPVAQFSSSKDVLELSNPDKNVAFNATYNSADPTDRSYDPDGGPDNVGPGPVATYQWSIVPASTGQPVQLADSTSPTLEYEFASASDVYSIFLTVTDAEGASTTARRELSVNAEPRAVIDVVPANRVVTKYPDAAAPPITLDGTRSFDPDSVPNTVVRWRWEIRRAGQASLLTSVDGPEYATWAPSLDWGTYDVRLYVYDKFGSQSPLVDTRVLDGPVARTSLQVKVNRPPVVTMPALDVRRLKPHTFAPGGGSTDLDGNIVSWTWTFVDADTNASIASVTNTTGITVQTFAGLPRIRATLSATDDNGATTVLTSIFQVTNQAPIAAWVANPPSLVAGFDPSNPATFTFTSNSYDNDGSIASCQWTFQNPTGPATVLGPQSCGISPVHTWDAAGDFEVRLRVWDNEGLQSETDSVQNIRVRRFPNACMTTTPSPPVVGNGGTVRVFVDCSNDPNPNPQPLTWTIDWGDFTAPASGVGVPNNRAHGYDRSRPSNTGTNGKYRIILTVTNQFGLTDTEEVLVSVNSKPVVVLNGTPVTGEPLIPINCPGGPGALVCTLPTHVPAGFFDLSESYDPDGGPGFTAAPISTLAAPARFDWFEPAVPVDQVPDATGLVPAPPFNLSGALAYGSQKPVVIRVYDADGEFTAIRVRMVPNAPPTGVTIQGSLAFGRNAPTTSDQVTTAATDPDGVTFAWTFKDGSGTVLATSTDRSPVVTFPTDLTGTVELTVTDGKGFAVDAPPLPFTVSDAKPVGIIGTTGVSPAGAVRIPPAGTRTEDRLVLSDSGTFSPITATFDADASYDPDGGPGLTSALLSTLPPPARYEWQVDRILGSAAPASFTPPANLPFTQTFSPPASGSATWRITLTVWDASNLSSTRTLLVRMNRPPAAVCTTANLTADTVPANFTFTNNSTDADGPSSRPVAMIWNWGDSTTTEVAWAGSRAKTYTALGTYNPTLTVVDADGVSAGPIPCPTTVKVHQKPVAVATASPGVLPTSGPYLVTLDGSGSYDPDADVPPTRGIQTWNWQFFSGGTSSFGSGTSIGTASGVSPSFTFPAAPATYWADLTVTDADGSSGTVRIPVRVNGKPIAVISNPEPVLSFQRSLPLPIDASGSSDPDGTIVEYRWEFRDETGVLIGTRVVASATTTATLNERVPAFGGDQNLKGTATLIVRDANGETDSTTRPFTVFNRNPFAVITTTPTPAVGLSVTLSGASSYDDGPIASWNWTVRNLATNSTTSYSGVSVTPTLPAGDYEATLVVVDADGEDSTYDTSLGQPIPPVTATFRLQGRPTAAIATTPLDTVFLGASIRTVTFDGSPTTDPDHSDAQLTFAWEVRDRFGDVMTTASGPGPHEFQFVGYGINTVRLTVTDPDGLSDTVEREVVLNQAPVVVVTPIPGIRNPGDGTEFMFVSTGTQDVDGTLISLDWALYDTDGTTVLSTATGAGPVTYTFPNVAGTYYAELTAVDDRGATTTRRISVRVNAAPTAVLQPGPFTLGRNQVFQLDGSASSDPDSATPFNPTGIQEYSWEFLDSNGDLITEVNSPLAEAVVSFPSLVTGGTVRLTVTDADGAVSTPVTAPFSVGNVAPTAEIFSSPSFLVDTPPFVVDFYHFLSSDIDGTIVSYRWEILQQGNPTALLDQTFTDVNDTVNFTFSAFGTYDVRLTVTDDLGATGTVTKTVKANRPPTAAIKDASSLTAQVGVAAVFDGSAPTYSNDLDGSVASYAWEFRDPGGAIFATRTDANPTVVFPSPGVYTVSLTVTDDDGALSAATPAEPITVTP